MLWWFIKTSFFSIGIILIVHYLVNFFTDALTVPKITQVHTQTPIHQLPEPTIPITQSQNPIDFFSKL